MSSETIRIRTFRRSVVPLAGFCLALALGGCTAAQSPSTADTSITGASASSAPSSAGTGGGVAASGQTAAAPRSPVGGQCPGGTTKATIGAAERCVAPGQLCEKTERAAYPAYGLLCLPRNNQYVLVTK